MCNISINKVHQGRHANSDRIPLLGGIKLAKIIAK